MTLRKYRNYTRQVRNQYVCSVLWKHALKLTGFENHSRSQQVSGIHPEDIFSEPLTQGLKYNFLCGDSQATIHGRKPHCKADVFFFRPCHMTHQSKETYWMGIVSGTHIANQKPGGESQAIQGGEHSSA